MADRTAIVPSGDPAPGSYALTPEAHALVNHAGIPGVGGGGGGDFRSEAFIPTLGQTVFALAAVPTDPDSVGFFINTVKYIQSVNYTVAAGIVTWLDTPFTLDALDIVEITYVV